MSYPPPPPPPPPPPSSTIPLSFPVSNVGSFMPQGPADNKHSDSQSQYVHAPLIMRPCNFDNHPSYSALFTSINPRMSQPNLFYKTRKCAKFEKGNCLIAENCNYAHGNEDMLEPPPNWRELICEKNKGAGNQNNDQRITNSGKVCFMFNKGKMCKYGETCRFLHERPSKVKTGMANPLVRECSAIHIGTMGPMMEHRRDTEQTKLNMCRTWEITGQCPFGERCHFAHAQSEYGNRIEANVMVNVGSIPAEALLVIVNDAAPTGTVIGAPAQEEEKFLTKWKVNRKITGIYGDWLDDHIVPEKLPNTTDG